MFFENIADAFRNFSGVDVLDIVLIAVFVYFVFKFFRYNNIGFVAGYIAVFLLFAAIIIAITPADSLSHHFCVYLLYLTPVFLVSIYSKDLRRTFTRLKRAKVRRLINASDDELKQTVENIVRATQNLAKKNVGALIVLASDNFPNHIAESGTAVNADVSSELIETIFVNKSPLHDGAVIIMGNKLIAAACLLPLSQDPNLPKDFGTRHRAGVGITEDGKAKCIIVSEETGIISFANAGRVKRYVDSEMLRTFLLEAFGLKENKFMTQKWFWRAKK